MYLRDSQLSLAYEQTKAACVAFIDESFQTQSKNHLPFYSMTATLVSSSQAEMDAVRRDIHGVVGDSFHATASAQAADTGTIDSLLDYIGSSNLIASILTVETEMAGPKFMMRAATLGQMLNKITEHGSVPEVLVADAQDAQWQKGTSGLDRNDLAVVAELIERQVISSRTRILHSKSTHENLLHLPDTVQWAAQKALRFGQSSGWDRISSTSVVYSVQMDSSVTITSGMHDVRRQARIGALAEATQVIPGARSAVNDLGRRGPRSDLVVPKTRAVPYLGSKVEMDRSLRRYQQTVSRP